MNKYPNIMVVRGQKKTTLLQAEAGAFGLGLANVLFLAWGVVFPNAPDRRKKRRGKKLKSLAINLEFVEIFSVILFDSFSRLHFGVKIAIGLHLTFGNMA